MARVSRLDIDDAGLAPSGPEIAQERRVAVFDLLEDNSFTLPWIDDRPAPDGPYALAIALREGRVVFGVSTEAGEKVVDFHLSFGPFRQAVKDYFQICASYYDAVKNLPPAQIEAIDMARRGIHNEGARILQERLDGKVIVDIDTARRLFTLICALSPQK